MRFNNGPFCFQLNLQTDSRRLVIYSQDCEKPYHTKQFILTLLGKLGFSIHDGKSQLLHKKAVSVSGGSFQHGENESIPTKNKTSQNSKTLPLNEISKDKESAHRDF